LGWQDVSVLIAALFSSWRRRRRHAPVVVSVAIAAVVCLLVTTLVIVQLTGADHVNHAGHPGPSGKDYVDITTVAASAPAPAATADSSTGSYVEHCGSNAAGGHRNADNVIASPGMTGGAHHMHDYVGNLSTNTSSTDASLAAAGTTCTDGDRSTFYWPVLRVLGEPGSDSNAVGGGADGNHGRILPPASVDMRFVGSPVSHVVPAPEFLRASVGDAKALTDGNTSVHPQWTCIGLTNRITEMYPLCPNESKVVRMFDFPNCWDGRSLDSPNHHTHLVSAAANGACPHATFPIPQLRIVLTYDVPPDATYAIDTFPAQQRSPGTDHADYIDVMSDGQQAQVVDCINSGRSCLG
jgi:hypothetical protein